MFNNIKKRWHLYAIGATLHLLFCIVTLCIATTVDAQEVDDLLPEETQEQKGAPTTDRKSDGLPKSFYTYLGSSLSFGGNNTTFSGWHTGKNQEIRESGLYGSIGATLIIIAEPLMGQATLAYSGIFNDTQLTSLYCARFENRIKYIYNSSSLPVAFTAGIGFYGEFSPASQPYNASVGAILAIGALYPLSNSWSLFSDFDLCYGTFAIGNNSRRLSYGISAGAATKVGNL